MRELTLEASNDLVRQIAHETDPTQAVIELIWNGIDAEADRVSVIYLRGASPPLDAIFEVIVDDEGHGIAPEEVQAEFGRIGDSWKSRGNRLSKNDKRRVHGSKGRGRLRAFALGSSVEWVSTAKGIGGLKTIRIAGSRHARNIFEWEELSGPHQTPGTIFRAFNQAQKSLASLETPKSKEVIGGAFAPMLLDHPEIVVSIDGEVLNPREQIAHDRTYSEDTETSGAEIPLTVRIIEWKTGTHREVYFADSDGQTSYAEDGRNLEPQFSFSAYISWPGLDDSAGFIGKGSLAPDPVSALISKANEIVIRHFRTRRRQTRRLQITIWKSQGIYPFQGEPKDETERIERVLFDVVSGTLSGQVAGNRLEAKLTLRLLQNVLKTQPGDMVAILNEVVSLSPDDMSALVRLLGSTSLSSIITAASVINARQHFLNALDHLIYGLADAKLVSERRHLHPMLERELWIFGEEYNLMSSERGLTELLRNHLRLSGLPAEVDQPVRTWDGKGGRTDLHLGAVTREHDRDRHLIVELKAPSVTLTPDELGQIKKYGDVLFDEPRFQSGTASWDLILIGGKINSRAKREIHNNSLDTGKFWEPPLAEPNSPRVRAFVRTWRDVIDENRRRLAFFTNAMESDPSVAESMTFLTEQYAALLPDGASNSADSDHSRQVG